MNRLNRFCNMTNCDGRCGICMPPKASSPPTDGVCPVSNPSLPVPLSAADAERLQQAWFAGCGSDAMGRPAEYPSALASSLREEMRKTASRLFPAPVEAEMPELASPWAWLRDDGFVAVINIDSPRTSMPGVGRRVVRLAVVEVLRQEPEVEVLTGVSGWEYRKRQGHQLEVNMLGRGSPIWIVYYLSKATRADLIVIHEDAFHSDAIRALLRGALDDREAKNG